MKRINRLTHFVISCSLAFTMIFNSAPVMANAADVIVEVSSLKGTVSVKRAASEKSFAAFVGLKLKQGDVVTTSKNGEVVINIGDDKTIKGLSNSSFKISSLSGTNEDSQAGFTLIKGTVFNEVRKKQSSAKGLTVQTGNTVVGVRGTTYSVSLRATDGVTVHTLEGSVFWDKVRERIESDSNASLVTGQDIVEAGQGGNTTRDGTYELSMDDLTQAELEYITQNAQAFPEDMVNEAQSIIDTLPQTPDTPDDTDSPDGVGPTQIVYEDAPPANTGGGGGGGGQAPVAAGPALTGAVCDLSGGALVLTYTFSEPVSSNSQITFKSTESGTEIPSTDYTTSITSGSSIIEIIFLGTYPERFQVASFNGVKNVAGGSCAATPVLGTPSGGPYNDGHINIFTAAELAKIGQDTDHPLGEKYALQADIALSTYGALWTPIGSDGTSFTGVFIGNGKTVSELTGFTGSHSDNGFFGVIGETAALVENLTVAGSISSSSGSSGNLGGIVGTLSNGELKNCNNRVAIAVADDINTGGIAGSMTGGKITKCTNSSPVSGGACTGGIVGEVLAGEITECANSSPVSGIAYAGGIVGYANSNIGDMHISRCTVTGDISASGTAGAARAGGIVGFAVSSSFHTSAITGCAVNSGSITATATGNSSYAGGIAGSFDDTIVQLCSNSSQVKAIVSNPSDGRGSYAGGIVGQFYNSGDIACCSNSGGVESTIDNNASNIASYAGGIAGYFTGHSIADCYVSGTSDVTITASNVNQQYVGGIAGYFYPYSFSCQLINCYIDNVTLSAGDTGTNELGGIVGQIDEGQVKYCIVYNGKITLDTTYGRIYDTKTTGAAEQNYALYDFATSKSAFLINNISPSLGVAHDAQNGANVDSTAILDQSWWVTNMGNSWSFGSSGTWTFVPTGRHRLNGMP